MFLHCRHVNLPRDQQLLVVHVLHAGVEHRRDLEQLLDSVAVGLVQAFRVDLDAPFAEHDDLNQTCRTAQSYWKTAGAGHSSFDTPLTLQFVGILRF